MKKAQTWSMDIIVAVSLFIIIFILFVGILSNMTEKQKESRLSEQGETIAAQISNPDNEFAFVLDEKVEDEELRNVINTYDGDYDTLKNQLNVRDNFCIYVEDSDGNLIPLHSVEIPEDAKKDDVFPHVYGIGSVDAKINDVECGNIVTS